MSNKISTKVCKKRLTVLWFVCGIGGFIVLALQSLLGRYDDKVTDAWSWFLPSIAPTLSLIIGVLVLDIISGKDVDKEVDKLFFWLAFVLSLIYLSLVAATLLLQPFTGVPLLDLMKLSNLWLVPLQGLTTAVLGAFFVKGERG